MSTLEYLDEDGGIWYAKVPGKKLHLWLSGINDNRHVENEIPSGVNRGKLIAELEARNDRHSKARSLTDRVAALAVDFGRVEDWKNYENDQGYTHLEELFLYQPREWRKQAREYFYRFGFELDRKSDNQKRILTWPGRKDTDGFDIAMTTPILAVLFHAELRRHARYGPLNFLLAYGVGNPLPGLESKLEEAEKATLRDEVSPLDYFLEYQRSAETYRLDVLRQIGNKSKCPRLPLIKELDFCDIVGQRLAKMIIRSEVVDYISKRNDGQGGIGNSLNTQPLSLILAGQSGVGKTELAEYTAKLLNRPGDSAFHKVDCGKLTDAHEVFGMSGCYQGAKEGSALNNFIHNVSLDESSVGIVLLDEIEKAGRDVIHGLYQVIDKGEWTNKKLGEKQTECVSCANIIFIMTTNVADSTIMDFTSRHSELYTASGDLLQDLSSDLESRIHKKLQMTSPFTAAFMGRVGRVVPFLPMAREDGEGSLLLGEAMTIAKILIEREQSKIMESTAGDARISTSTKHEIAKIVVHESVVENGVRGLQKAVRAKVSKRVKHSLLLEKGGISKGSNIRYTAERSENGENVIFRPEDKAEVTQDETSTLSGEDVDSSMFE